MQPWLTHASNGKGWIRHDAEAFLVINTRLEHLHEHMSKSQDRRDWRVMRLADRLLIRRVARKVRSFAFTRRRPSTGSDHCSPAVIHWVSPSVMSPPPSLESWGRKI